MRERIKQIIEREGMSQSQFADFIGVNRPTLSHVIAGRNNPSIEIVLKIHQKFPKINLTWILDGIGPYVNGEEEKHFSNNFHEEQIKDNIELSSQRESTIGKETIESHPNIQPSIQPSIGDTPSHFYQGDLFAENPIFVTESMSTTKKRKEMPLQPPLKVPYMSDTQTDYARKFLQRKIVEIKIFYDDGTYETFKQ